MQVTILLAPRDIMRDIYFNKDVAKLVEDNLFRYEKAYTFEFKPSAFDSDIEPAEEAFDLTNNPSRQDERVKTYGTKRSLSVGDVVDVDGKKLLCQPFGWLEL